MTAKVALVTGASRGIGQAIAIAVGELGYLVVGTATSQAGADAITAHFSEAGIEGVGMMLNVSDTASVDVVVKSINEQFGAPSVLINNAGRSIA
jgi:3-oxoacyl-[acyl-carrier protein] reductase